LKFKIIELSCKYAIHSGPDGWKKSGVMVEFSDLSFHLRSPGDLEPEELDEVVDFLADRMDAQERTELYHLSNFHEVLSRFVVHILEGW